ncbi:MAG: glycosyltransferase family 2 protein [Thermodesulfobacteriota bacterium]
MPPSDNKIELSIVMPCLNEAETIAGCVEQARRYLSETGINGEIVVADNGSTDQSRAIAAAAGARVVEITEKGYGSALAGGITAAVGEWVIMGDADGSYDFSGLTPFIDKLRQGFDLVIGNRFEGGIFPQAMPFLHKYLGNPVLTGIGRLFFKAPVGDFHCGLRGFRKAAIAALDLRTTGMEFASEMIIKARLQNLRIVEVPTTLSPDGRSRKPHLRTWRDGWRHLRFMLIYSPKWLFFYPGLSLLAVGLALGAWLLPGPRTVAGVTLDIHTLLYCSAAVFIGFQSILFAAFYKIFALTENLQPPDPVFNRLFTVFTLERGLIAGCLLFLLGLAGSLYAVGVWESVSFGNLDPQQTLRLVVPSVLAMILGCQIVLSSFFLSILGINRK